MSRFEIFTTRSMIGFILRRELGGSARKLPAPNRNTGPTDARLDYSRDVSVWNVLGVLSCQNWEES